MPLISPRRVVGVGAGGHAKVLMDIVRLTPSLELLGMLDADRTRWGTDHFGSPILGSEDLLGELVRQARLEAVFIGVGGVPSNTVRRALFERMKKLGLEIVSLVHPSAVLAPHTRVEEGVMVMAGVVVNPDSVLERGVIVNTGAIVEHDCRMKAFAHICPGARIAGGVTVGEEAFVGLGSCVIQGVQVGARAVIGAGAVVLEDVPERARVGGCPARPLRPCP